MKIPAEELTKEGVTSSADICGLGHQTLGNNKLFWCFMAGYAFIVVFFLVTSLTCKIVDIRIDIYIVGTVLLFWVFMTILSYAGTSYLCDQKGIKGSRYDEEDSYHIFKNYGRVYHVWITVCSIIGISSSVYILVSCWNSPVMFGIVVIWSLILVIGNILAAKYRNKTSVQLWEELVEKEMAAEQKNT
ncbi:MAG TPA: hypothetical protein O0X39_05825 [Methanocorpusculum sp.]|nr:hypothetical protein [Methanocorpusculum sp.]